MINSRKKGFTLVELVIVIAVVAILAAVLIPTFSNLVKKANVSADTQAVVQMNKALAIEAADGKIDTIEKAANALADAGYNDELTPVTKGYSFYWYPKYNTIILADGENKLVYPTNNKEIEENFEKDFGSCYNLKVAYSKQEATSSNLTELVADGSNVTLKEEVSLTPVTVEGYSRQAGLVIPSDETVALDLGGNKLSVPTTADGKDCTAMAIIVDGELVLSNGIVEGRGIVVRPGGKLIIEDNVTINAIGSSGGQAIRNEGGIVVINGGTFNALKGDCASDQTSEPACIYNTGMMTINGGTFTTVSDDYAILTFSGNLTINKATVQASRGVIAVNGGKVEINDGTFECDSKYGGEVTDSAYVLYYKSSDSLNSYVKINGGTYTNKAGKTVKYIDATNFIDEKKLLG